MIMPSYSTVPESMLGNTALLQKFSAPALAGLRGMGCDCSETDPESGMCVDPDPCGSSGGSTDIGTFPTTPITTTTPITLNCPGDPGCPGNPITVSMPPVSSGGGLSTSQQLALDQAILSGGTQVAKIIAAGATGTTVLPNGSVISPGATAVGAIGAAGSTTIVLVVAVLFGLMFLRRGN